MMKESSKNTIMDTISKTIKEWELEYSGLHFKRLTIHAKRLSNTDIESEYIKVDIDDIKIINALDTQINELQDSTLLTISDDTGVYRNTKSKCESQRKHIEDSRPKFRKGNLKHQDSGYSSPTASRAIDLPLPIQSQTALTFDEKMDASDLSLIENESTEYGHDSTFEEGKTWQVVTSKISRPEYKSSSVYCDDRAMCNKGKKCKGKHTPKERETYEARTIAKAANDKE